MSTHLSKCFYPLLLGGVILFFITMMAIAAIEPNTVRGQWVLDWLSHYLGLLALLTFWHITYSRLSVRRVLRATGRLLGQLRRVPDRTWVACAAISFFAIAYYLSGAIFHHLPTESDSMAQYAGARIFSRGEWVAQSHPLPRFFDVIFFFNDGTFYTVYPPGHMFFLALGHLVGNPAIINPFLGALSLISTYYLTREIAGAQASRISLLLFLVSPFIIFLSAEFDNRSTGLLCSTLFALFYIKTLKTKISLYALLSGMALGYLFITRPQTAVPYALPFAVYGLYLLQNNWRAHIKIFVTMIAGLLPFIAFFLFYNWQTNGDPFLTGYQKLWGEKVVPAHGFTTLAFWRDIWIPQTEKIVAYAELFDRQFFCWPIASLAAAIALWLFKAQKPFCGLLAAAFLSICVSLTLTPYVYVIFGPRYLYETSSIVIVLTAIFIARCPAVLRTRKLIRIPLVEWRALWLLSLVVMVAAALATTISDLAHTYKHNYRIGRPDFSRMIEETVKKPALVIVHPGLIFIKWGYYDALLYHQPPTDKDAIIYVRDLGSENKKIMAYYPDRYVYRTLSETEIKLIRGIVPASPARAGRGSSSGTQ